MPYCGGQIMTCDLPVGMDTYKGCSFKCSYCNERMKNRVYDEYGMVYEGIGSLKNFIAGFRGHETNWCDWDIPLHWGNHSDPFQPCELELGESYKRLQVFAGSKYPVVISTKSLLVAIGKYLEILKDCNVVVQISMTTPKVQFLYEPYAPNFNKRLSLFKRLSYFAKRLIIRCQPYYIEDTRDILDLIPVYADSGVYGITLESIQYRKKYKDFIKNGNNYCMNPDDLEPYFEKIREECHRNNLKFYSAENLLRYMGDSLTCCGVDGLKGFEPSRANMNYLGYGIEFTDKMKESGTGQVFENLTQHKIVVDGQKYRPHELYKDMSYKDAFNFNLERMVQYV